MEMEPTTIAGIALVLVGVLLAVKVAKLALKLLFLAVVVGGLYLWFGA